MDYVTKVVIIKQSMADLTPFLYLQSVAFFTPKGENCSSLSSGTLVSIGDRLFICTASHSVPKSDDHVWGLSGEPKKSTSPDSPIVNKGFYPNDDPDVGFLELGMNRATEFLKKEACPLGCLAIRGTGRPLRPTILIGFPREYVKRTGSNERSAFVPQAFGYYTVPVMENEWQKELNADPTKHIILDYPDTPAERMDNDASVMLPEPYGISGGGLWDQGFEDNVLWTRESARLIGVQSGWFPTKRLACVVQIIHWLRLIHANYPDLRPVLVAQFGELAPG